MNKYQTFVNILDQLRSEAPIKNSRYYPPESDVEKVNQARSRAFIHLFLKVQFGLIDFQERERLITDGSYDGGIDAYFIDEESKTLHLIQSKFRTNEENFSSKNIEWDELLNMDVGRIIDGEKVNEDEIPYNGKIQQLQREMFETPDIGRYKQIVVVLANVKDSTPSKLKKLTGGFPCDVFDFEQTYNELVFPVVAGTYYNHQELRIELNLNNKTSQGARISYNVQTEFVECEISVLFVPTLEIAKTLYKYKNSILKFNPRSYLELSHNPVNREIANTILSAKSNEFALYNNGITILSYETEFSDKVGQKHKGQLILTRPQIVNGGQTAYTLSRIYENNIDNPNLESIFAEKEVLVKVITLPGNAIEQPEEQLRLIESVSRATNQQTPVDEADRRSNDKIQIEMQEAIYSSTGYFYERKRGEFADGLKAGYVDESLIISREVFIRICRACNMNPSAARRSSSQFLFREDNFADTLNDVERHLEYFFGYRCYQLLNQLEKKYSREENNRYGIASYGNALRYGKYALVCVASMFYENERSLAEFENITHLILEEWISFETYVASLNSNYDYFTSYFDPTKEEYVREMNFNNYYKGRTLNQDINTYFSNNREKFEELIEKRNSRT